MYPINSVGDFLHVECPPDRSVLVDDINGNLKIVFIVQ